LVDTKRVSVLVYAAWWSPTDRQLIDDALANAGLPYYRIRGGGDPPSGVPESFAVQSVLNVAKVIASRLPQPLPKDCRQDLDHLLAQVILLGAKARVSPASPVPDFETMVKDALRPWWPGATLRKTAPRHTSSPRVPCPKQAQWLANHFRALGSPTPHRLEALGGPDRKTIRKLLAGHGTRDDVLEKLAQALTDAYRQNGRTILIRPDAIPRD
jgi:hypothetical protein